MSNLETHKIELSTAERKRLEELAIQTRARPTKSLHAYQPSWKFMLRLIGRGELDIVERVPYQLPAGLVEQAEAVEAQSRLAEKREQAAQKTPVKLEQLEMELEPA